ncbi:hypothetical protein UNDKW_5652 [Undibacterium sp. KW1]|uniref:hypothetical protein n=1 Tax=Undibacterium sp. KW1 TaxID=2058624 RepID=UPI001331DE86|nr:hypothetical protein [Undibacterium sp. KW1]BBB63925.1 hypothetical protein UNDKW_5652 [Undibacterium sp. KW1]
MAYDLVVGKSSKVKDAPDIVGGIEFDELPQIARLLKRADISFLHRISNLFEDQAFSEDEIEQAFSSLLPLLLLDLQAGERQFLQKLISVLTYAKWKQSCLYCVAD